MIVRSSIRLLLILLAPVVVFAQLDRASYQRPELSVFVPAPFRSFAQSPTALLALAGGSASEAQAEARRLVRRRPMPAEHLFTLAMAELRAGRPAAFAVAFRAASTRGWRFAPLQVAGAQAAIQNGDAAGAAKRVAALWAAEHEHASLPILTRTMLEMPGGPEAFGQAMAGTNVWRSHFLPRWSEVASADAALSTVRAASKAGASFDCTAIAAFRLQLERQGKTASRLGPCR